MTESEAVEKLKAYAKCQSLQVKGIYEDCNNKICDNCDLCYMQGTTGEHREAIDIAIQALEKQIPKKPMMAYDDKIDSNWVSCPICANGIGWELRARKIKFCWDCGQRLYFGDDEK